MKTIGSLLTPAKFSASWKSPVLLAPSPKYAMHDVVVLFHLEREAEAGGDRQVRAEHARVAEDAELVDAAVQRRIAALREARSPCANICAIIARGSTPFIRNAPRSRCSGQIQSSLPQAEAGADDDRFLADAGVDAAAHLALAHAEAEALVERADQLEPVEHLEQLVGAELEFRALDWRARFDLRH